MTALDDDANVAAQRRRLRSMRLIPLALLVAMALVYGLTHEAAAGGPGQWQAWLHAFAEAAMVGAMADWFAVTALFRHPLGLPIPHTAIVPRRKDEIGATLAHFVADHFLVESTLRPKLQAWSPSTRLLHWLRQPAAQRQLAAYSLRMMDWLFHAVDEQVPRRFLQRLVSEQLDDEQLARYAGYGLDLLIKGGRHQDLLTIALRAGAEQLRKHRLDIRLHVRTGSPWWMPGFVDDRIVIQMLDRVENLLLAMADDPQHELRRHYHRQVEEWVATLQAGQPGEWLSQWRAGLGAHPVVQQYIASLWRELGRVVHQASGNPNSLWQRQLVRFYAAFAEELENDNAMQALLDQWLNNALVAVVSGNRHEIVSIISDTIAGWDAQSTAQLIELQIGADLQYIRINGTVVGGLIGLLLFLLSHSLF